jgi:predicted metal-dependent hydrolase
VIGTDAIQVSQNKPTGAQVKALFRLHARDALAAASDRYAHALGRTYARLSIRDTRSRWGSCSSQGTLMYSWRLIMAPPAVLDYVAAHEVAHLVEMNHQPAFWDVVAGICPDYATHRAWLRTHGDSLHRINFDN